MGGMRPRFSFLFSVLALACVALGGLWLGKSERVSGWSGAAPLHVTEPPLVTGFSVSRRGERTPETVFSPNEEAASPLSSSPFESPSTSFDASLNAFALRQQRVIDALNRARVANEAMDSLRVVHFVCAWNDVCGGWADRLKGAMSAATIAVLTKSSIALDIVRNYDLRTVYDPTKSHINWDWDLLSRGLPRSPHRRVLNLDCMHQPCDACIMPRLWKALATGEFNASHEVYITGNYDCSGKISRGPALRDMARSLGLSIDANWKGKLAQALLKPSDALIKTMQLLNEGFGKENAVSRTVPVVWYPESVMHVRLMGTYTLNGVTKVNIEGDPTVSAGSVELPTLIGTYAKCILRVSEAYGVPLHSMTPIFVAVDNEDVIGVVAKALNDAGVGPVLFGSRLGAIGHIEKSPLANVHFRAHAEFEFMRNAKFLFAAESGLSLFSYKVRVDPDMIVHYGLRDPCTFPFMATPIAMGLD